MPKSIFNSLVLLLLFSVDTLIVERSSAAAASDQVGQTKRVPNIVVIIADDLGWKDVGYQGTDFYETPRIAQLAKEGMIFSAAYAPAGNCQPTRACLISGQYTPRHQVYAVGSTNRGPKKCMRTIPIPNRSGLAAKSFQLRTCCEMRGTKPVSLASGICLARKVVRRMSKDSMW